MSFSEEIKNELISLKEESSQGRLAILAALIKINGNLKISNDTLEIVIKTENEKIAQFIIDMLHDEFSINPRVSYFKTNNLKKNPYFLISIHQRPLEILNVLEIFDKDGLIEYPSKKLVNNSHTLICYLRGAFLASGSINHPQSSGGYHLEINCNEEEYAKYLALLLNRKYLNAKVCKRRNKYIVYLKRGETIADFLKLVGAIEGLLFYEDLRIQRDFENNLNRSTNCYAANEEKRRLLAEQQLKIVETLIQQNKIVMLQEKEAVIAKLRIDNPDGTLSELAEDYVAATGKNISKSTIRAVFIRLESFINEK